MTQQDVVTLDVRSIPPRERHPTIFDTFDGLPVSGTIRLINDHDPKPLFYQFEAERPGEAQWDYQEQGPETWVVHITKIEHRCC